MKKPIVALAAGIVALSASLASAVEIEYWQYTYGSRVKAIDALIEKAANDGVREFIVGMSHRGRLNTLTNIFGKPVEDIFNEFDGKDYEEKAFDGDVKYHLGWTSNRETDSGLKVFMNIAPNPSHLEAVGPVVQGIARAKQEKYHPNNIENVFPIIIHGDAAIAGQGIVYEVIQMAQLKGYRTGGTLHIVINNQVGFTTNYLDARSSTYLVLTLVNLLKYMKTIISN